MAVLSHAQFINNGATVTIQNGATLRVESSFINNSGTVTNNGTLEVQNDFTNAATFTSATGSTVKFIGAVPSNVTSGGAVFQNVSMEKTAEDITLVDDMAVASNLTFTNDDNKVVLGANDLTIQSGGSIASADNNEYVVTNGTGSLIKGMTANGTVTHEIGDAANYTPLSSAVTGSSYSSATLGARVYTSGLQAKYADASDYINREWHVVSSGISDYSNLMTGTYVDGDIAGTESMIKGCTYHTSDWRFNGAAGDAGANTVTASTTTGDVFFSGQNFYGKVNLKAYLQGPYNASTGMMNTGLNSSTPSSNILEQFALTSPYTDAPASVSSGFFLANPNIVDWVQLEFRDPATPSTTSTNKVSAFIKNNGDIVGVDGVSLPHTKNALPTSVVVLSHRNHLPIRTVNAGLSLIEPSQHDFSTGLGQAFTNTQNTVNDAMTQLSTGVYGLYRGNPNGNLFINSADLVIVTNQSNPIKSSVYNSSDLNLNGSVNSGDLVIVTNASNPIKNAHN